MGAHTELCILRESRRSGSFSDCGCSTRGDGKCAINAAGEDNTGNERSISLGVYFGESAGRKLARKTPLMTRKKYRVARPRL